MKRALSSLLTVAAFAWCLSALPAASTVHQSAAQQPAASAETDPAHELFIQTCNRCHDAARITALRRTKTEWEEVINKMIERGATGSEEDFVTVFGYLRRHYGKVYINSATTDEITTTLRPLQQGRGRHRRLPQGERHLPGLRRGQEGPGHRRQDARRAQGRGRVLSRRIGGRHSRFADGITASAIERPCCGLVPERISCARLNTPCGGSHTS